MGEGSIFDFAYEVTPFTWGPPSEAFEPKQQMITRVRRRITAAVLRRGKTWEQLFQDCDRNRDGTLDWKELKALMRDTLKIPNATVCDTELAALFEDMDNDQSGTVDAAELLDYLQRGKRTQEEERARWEQRMKRVSRNLRMAWKDVNGNEAAVRNLFNFIDLDSSQRLTPHEFEFFIRNYLKLNRWDIRNKDLVDYYRHIDKDGDGIDVLELLAGIRDMKKNLSTLGAQSFAMKRSDEPARLVRKHVTFRQKLADGMAKSSSLPSLTGLPMSNLGRDHRPTTRFASSLAGGSAAENISGKAPSIFQG